MRGAALKLVAALLLCASSAAAQRGRMGVAGGGRRAVLEREFRARGEQLVRRQLNLSDAQLEQLRAVNGRLDGRRRALLQQERATRMELRQEIGRGSSADQARVSDLMRQARELQQQRFELQQVEQQQLSGFLTPVQQAQYFALQAQLRQKLRDLRAREGEADSTSP